MNQMIQINRIGYEVTEVNGFAINRPGGSDDYLFLHFISEVFIRINNKTVICKPGACLIYSPGVMQNYGTTSGVLFHNWFHFTPEDDGAFKQFVNELNLPLNEIFYPCSNDFITTAVKAIESEYLRKDGFFREMITYQISLLFIRLSRAYHTEKGKGKSPVTAEKFKQARITIMKNVSCDWDLAEMAALTNLSIPRFSDLYKQYFNISPKADLIAARIEKAKYLLSNEAVTVQDASAMVGYNNPFHFIRQFKQITGITPGKYKDSL